jgi:MFS family permease
MTHGRLDEADRIVDEIEARCEEQHEMRLGPTSARLRLRKLDHLGLIPAARLLFQRYPRRAVLGLALMTAQAFCYNAVFFTYALILSKFYGVPSGEVGWFMLPFSVSNFLGPLILGRLFDTVGRKTMIAGTYALSGALMIATGGMFAHGALSAAEQTGAWLVIFFFASAAASSAYLTVAESFPLELRALAIAIFYAIGTGAGGIAGPALFGVLIDSGSRAEIFWGYALGGGLMIGAAVVEAWLGLASERRPLEEVAPPLSACE